MVVDAVGKKSEINREILVCMGMELVWKWIIVDNGG